DERRLRHIRKSYMAGFRPWMAGPTSALRTLGRNLRRRAGWRQEAHGHPDDRHDHDADDVVPEEGDPRVAERDPGHGAHPRDEADERAGPRRPFRADGEHEDTEQRPVEE